MNVIIGPQDVAADYQMRQSMKWPGYCWAVRIDYRISYHRSTNILEENTRESRYPTSRISPHACVAQRAILDCKDLTLNFQGPRPEVGLVPSVDK